jgi:hypothetical protein
MKTFKQMFDEEMMTTGDAGIPQDTKDAMPKKKRKRKILTRNYIEVNGKRKKLVN